LKNWPARLLSAPMMMVVPMPLLPGLSEPLAVLSIWIVEEVPLNVAIIAWAVVSRVP
jgi:hypothetical protein